MRCAANNTWSFAHPILAWEVTRPEKKRTSVNAIWPNGLETAQGEKTRGVQNRTEHRPPGFRAHLHLSNFVANYRISYRPGGIVAEGNVGLPSIVSGSINSVRVPSGSKKLAMRLRLIPTWTSSGRRYI